MALQTDHDKGMVRASSAQRKSTLPEFLRPQLATLVDTVPQGEAWLHEIKFDGYRILSRIADGRARFLTREAQDWTGRFGSLVDAAQDLPVRRALLDGEVVALEADGKTNFQLLQNSLREKAAANLVYFVFDLLYLDNRDLTGLPLRQRKELLERILKPNGATDAPGPVRYSDHWAGQGEELYKAACKKGLEGIVSKRGDRPYRPGRGRDWLKIKCSKRQEFVIGGFTDPAGARSGLGALLVGIYDDRHRLLYSGKVGTGFTRQSLHELRSRLDALERKSPPFSNPPRGEETKGVHWVEPKLAGEVSFSEWTKDNLLRHPSFQGLREDKPAAEIMREKARQPKNPAGSSSGDAKVAGVKLTHPDRVLYPEQGITKLDLADYYQRIADWIMPHVEGRPLTLLRCPEGHKKQCFIQRHIGEASDPALHPVRVKEKGSAVSYVSVDSLAGLVALVQMGVLEVHTWGSRKGRLEQPDRLIFDLDPDPAAKWGVLKEAAYTLRSRLADLNLAAFVKTTGGKGLHVVVPIAPKENWDFAREFSRALADSIVSAAPDRYTATMSKAQRKGKIFIDYLRNARTATAVCAYSPRARSGAPVSVPLRWEELSQDPRSHFTLKNVPERLSRRQKDPWADYEAARAPITRAMMKRLRA